VNRGGLRRTPSRSPSSFCQRLSLIGLGQRKLTRFSFRALLSLIPLWSLWSLCPTVSPTAMQLQEGLPTGGEKLEPGAILVAAAFSRSGCLRDVAEPFVGAWHLRTVLHVIIGAAS
jgi:hypothetical protein